MIKILALIIVLYQGTPDVVSNIETAMKAGNAKELVKYFNETVELKIDGESANYSKNQSEMVLRKFFKEHPSRGFFYVHNGSSPEGLKYAIGQYSTDDGNYRIVLLLKGQGKNYQVDAMRITRDESLNSDG